MMISFDDIKGNFWKVLFNNKDSYNLCEILLCLEKQYKEKKE